MTVKKSVLVTGGAGFIGANLCRALLATGRYEITVIDDLSTGDRSTIDGLDLRFREASILDERALANATPAGGVVVHLAEQGSVPRSLADPFRSHEINATGTMLVLEAARTAGVAQVIVASSAAVYGERGGPTKHESLPPAPKSSYGAAKLAAEAYALAHQQAYGLGVLAFRLFNVFGPLQPANQAYAAVIPSFIDRALRDEPLLVHGDGKQSRDFTYIDTVVATIIDAIDRGLTFDGPVNLAFGTQVSLLEVVDLIGFEVGRPLEVTHIEPRPGDIGHAKADPERFRSLFRDIEPIDIADGIRRAVGWFKTLDPY